MNLSLHRFDLCKHLDNPDGQEHTAGGRGREDKYNEWILWRGAGAEEAAEMNNYALILY